MLARRVNSYYEFADAILQLRNASAVLQTTDPKELIAPACYLLGWFLGDLGKHYRDGSNMIMDVDIQLTRKHPPELGSW